ncbi:group III truncated hemoglobin [Robertkochia aurantiaca]|uniref:group III truncated hemoglobin n=1 Tax=Robertkochia aurantiaca TaxID=2873700 RepID=UPI001CCA717E|nr:group III truncated hemoglobin [Robertkochia sp. 3YJGBD-33]
MKNQLKEISDREDVAFLVRQFYGRIRKDEVLGPIFEKQITDWEAHFELLTDFWESQLFLRRSYRGNPVVPHVHTDKSTGGSITMDHFGRWINLWIDTLDTYFEGERAWIAKNRARKMATMLYLEIFKARE